MYKIKTFLTNSHGVIFCFLTLSFAFDFIDKIEIYYGFDFIKFNRIIKLIFLIYSVTFIALHSRYLKDNFKALSLIVVFLSVTYISKNNFSERYFFEYLRYVFVLLIFPLLHYTYINKDQGLFAKLYKFFNWLILINSILILIGVLFEVKIFQTYENSHRLGYNGFLLSQGFTPFFYLCATTVFWVYKDIKMLLLLLVLCSLSGVKGVYFGEFLLLSIFIISNKRFKKQYKILAFSILSIIFTALLVKLLLTPMFVKVIDSKGLISAIFSYRTDNVIELVSQMNESNFNILTGTYRLKRVRLEMQFFDIILFFGILGLIAYIVFLDLLNKSIVKSVVSKGFFITTITLSALSGNLLYIPLSSILMFLVLMSLYNNKIVKQYE